MLQPAVIISPQIWINRNQSLNVPYLVLQTKKTGLRMLLVPEPLLQTSLTCRRLKQITIAEMTTARAAFGVV